MTHNQPNPYSQYTPEHKVWEIAQDNGIAAASWVFDGRQDAYRIVLNGIEDCDPEVLDYFRVPSLSGEFADDYSEDDLMGDVGWVPNDGTMLRDDLADQYNREVSDSFWSEVERIARENLT